MDLLVALSRSMGSDGKPFLTSHPQFGGGKFVCHLADHIARSVCFFGNYELIETALILKLLATGGVFIGVGANWGYFSLLGASIVGSQGSVFCLEPDPRLFPLMSENLKVNHFSQAIPLQLAASSEAGTLTLEGFDATGDNWGVSQIVQGPGGSGGTSASAATQFRVEAISIDELTQRHNLSHVNLVKMDIEGAEEFALAGMASGLEQQKYDAIVLELHPAALASRGKTVAHSVEPLQRAGYQAFQIDHSPEAVRRMVYTRSADIRTFLKPADSIVTAVDRWPHMLWLRPGLDLVQFLES